MRFKVEVAVAVEVDVAVAVEVAIAVAVEVEVEVAVAVEVEVEVILFYRIFLSKNTSFAILSITFAVLRSPFSPVFIECPMISIHNLFSVLSKVRESRKVFCQVTIF